MWTGLSIAAHCSFRHVLLFYIWRRPKGDETVRGADNAESDTPLLSVGITDSRLYKGRDGAERSNSIVAISKRLAECNGACKSCSRKIWYVA